MNAQTPQDFMAELQWEARERPWTWGRPPETESAWCDKHWRPLSQCKPTDHGFSSDLRSFVGYFDRYQGSWKRVAL